MSGKDSKDNVADLRQDHARANESSPRRIPHAYLRKPLAIGAVAIVGASLLAGYPWLFGTPLMLQIAISVLIYVPLVVGQNIITGNSGQLSMGHAAFYAVGAYCTGILVTRLDGFPALAAVALAIVGAGLLGLLIGFPALRVSGDYLFILTIGLNLIVVSVATQWEAATGGARGLTRIPLFSVGGYEFRTPEDFYYVVLIAAVLCVGVAAAVLSSRFGRLLEAARDDRAAAEACGVSITGMRLSAFVIGSSMAGLSGAMFAYNLGFVGPQSFTLQQSLLIFEMVIIGGLASIRGSILGAIILVALPEALRFLQDYRLGLGGVIILILMVWRPNGLLGKGVVAPLVKS